MITTIVGTGKDGYSGDVPFDFKHRQIRKAWNRRNYLVDE